MSFSKPNASDATRTKNRVAPSPSSGLCVNCLDGCAGTCEVGKSAIRGKEVIYPGPFGKVISGSEKDYPIDFSHFNISGTCVGAQGIKADSDKAIFSAVNVSTEVGAEKKITMRVPFFTGAVGSTEIARVNWEEMAIGAAISGTILVCGENIVGVDPQSEFRKGRKGRVINSPELKRRIKTFQDWYEGDGEILLQLNIEDRKLGSEIYAIEKLGVKAIELKWGQGAKSIGGEIKVNSLERAQELKKRGYLILPDPEDPVVQEAFKNGAFKEFERHSRLGMIDEESFLREVERLRGLGAKYVTLKTGAYRPADLARAVKFASEARIDLLTVDGAGGGTGMSPWRMMNEWGIPTVYAESLLYQYLKTLDDQKKFVPSCAIAGGIALEDQVFKALALGAPYIKAVCMGRATMAAAMVGKNVGNKIKELNKIQDEEAKMKEVAKQWWGGHGDTLEQVFFEASNLKKKYGKDFEKIPPGAVGMYTFYQRLAVGLQQLMAGARKFSLKYISRDDIFALTEEAARLSGIPYITEVDKEEVEKILKS